MASPGRGHFNGHVVRHPAGPFVSWRLTMEIPGNRNSMPQDTAIGANLTESQHRDLQHEGLFFSTPGMTKAV